MLYITIVPSRYHIYVRAQYLIVNESEVCIEVAVKPGPYKHTLS